MEVVANLKNARMSAKKLRDVARVLKGKRANDAVQLLAFIQRKSARLISGVLKSAIANGENNKSIPSAEMVVDNVIIEEGAAFKRFVPASRGSAHPIRKRTSHIVVILKQVRK